ncbi:outer membrane transport energization protein ExbD [Panacagrimonas perspica]|uniref:Outer membrane transport energization protein ExbD n=1 Tax=Panacagrimonas perspica TaxID=381431 RepID=A0A4S3K1V1_9GAMM|nr:biopolymer transporter ExbD [Panacagrimonas perspica]TDU30992.1 outer membrane transport energization protein ExbD [Panacagrimonas perspica]THD01858.1 biopolymer transporter ExbD [Panacagrimonas perspica]
MAFGSFNSTPNSAPMAEINVIPLVDIMLVLLVIFIITAPLLTHAVKIDLPKAESSPNVLKVDNVQLAIDGQGTVFWNGEVVDDVLLGQRMHAAGELPTHPEIHIHADRNARYETIAQVMSEAAKNGLSKIGFVTDPSHSTP